MISHANGQMDQGQDPLQRAVQLQQHIHRLLPGDGVSVETRRLRGIKMADLVEENKEARLFEALQSVTFVDVRPDDIVVTLNKWNLVLRDTVETLEQARRLLRGLRKNKYETFYAIQEFIIELSKVISKCILKLGQSHPSVHG